MPDHIHLFAAFGPESVSLSIWVKSLKILFQNVCVVAEFPRRIGRKVFSTMFCGVRSRITRSGST
jgi:hypothetical protein